MTYRVNEVFYTLQGEGANAGRPFVFVRLSDCNLRCDGQVTDAVSMPVCDTEFVSGDDVSVDDLITRVNAVAGECRNVLFTGGEPMLQVDEGLVSAFIRAGYMYLALETNGTRGVNPDWFNWVTVSPKVAEHVLKVTHAHELRYVRHAGTPIPEPLIEADFKYLSPAWDDDPAVVRANLEHCVRLVKENPEWRLSIQQHKVWRVR